MVEVEFCFAADDEEDSAWTATIIELDGVHDECIKKAYFRELCSQSLITSFLLEVWYGMLEEMPSSAGLFPIVCLCTADRRAARRRTWVFCSYMLDLSVSDMASVVELLGGVQGAPLARNARNSQCCGRCWVGAQWLRVRRLPVNLWLNVGQELSGTVRRKPAVGSEGRRVQLIKLRSPGLWTAAMERATSTFEDAVRTVACQVRNPQVWVMTGQCPWLGDSLLGRLLLDVAVQARPCGTCRQCTAARLGH